MFLLRILIISETVDFSESFFGLCGISKPLKSEPLRNDDGNVFEVRNMIGLSLAGGPIVGLDDMSLKLSFFNEELLQFRRKLEEPRFSFVETFLKY